MEPKYFSYKINPRYPQILLIKQIKLIKNEDAVNLLPTASIFICAVTISALCLECVDELIKLISSINCIYYNY